MYNYLKMFNIISEYVAMPHVIADYAVDFERRSLHTEKKKTYPPRKLHSIFELKTGTKWYKINLEIILRSFEPDFILHYENWVPKKHIQNTGIYNRCSCTQELKTSIEIKHHLSECTINVGFSCIEKFSNEIHVSYQKSVLFAKDPFRKECLVCKRKISQDMYDWANKYGSYHKKCHPHIKKINYLSKTYTDSNIQVCKTCGKIYNGPHWKVRCLSCYIRSKNK